MPLPLGFVPPCLPTKAAAALYYGIAAGAAIFAAGMVVGWLLMR